MATISAMMVSLGVCERRATRMVVAAVRFRAIVPAGSSSCLWFSSAVFPTCYKVC